MIIFFQNDLGPVVEILQVYFMRLLVLLQAASGFASGLGLKTSGLLHEVSGNRKFLKLQLVHFQLFICFNGICGVISGFCGQRKGL